MTFEEAMKGLESIVSKLEEGDVPLEQAINYFQEGMALSKMCHEKLQKVEKQMDFILKKTANWHLLVFRRKTKVTNKLASFLAERKKAVEKQLFVYTENLNIPDSLKNLCCIPLRPEGNGCGLSSCWRF